MKKPTGKTIALLIVAVVGAGAWYMTKQRPLVVDVAIVEKNIPIKVFGLGTVEARILSKIGFSLSNSIVQLNADEGQQVRKGDVLARLDNTEQLARLAKSKAGILSASAAVKGAAAAILKAKAVLAKRTQTNRRQQELYARRTISAEMVELAKLEQDLAQADLDIAQSNLLAAKATFANAQAQLKLDKVVLGQHILRAPYDAVITARQMELGTVVKAGESVFTLVDPKSVWVLGHISESRSGLIALDHPAEIRLRSRPHELFKGKVQRIDIESDRVTEERRVFLSCHGCLDKFSLGEQAEVYVTTAILEKALFVPENAVDDFDERQMIGTVWILINGSLARQGVTFGHRTLDARLSIVSGLPKNAKVLTRLPKLLKQGRSARIEKDNNS
ncbi:MAG: efflux RND transporter periplasmic adaptor subunit [Rhodospirillaceae bacterium]|nr:efflux RND transporter periplasmic adaptor subunit [Rhodospirillaceae bacterium]